MAHCFKCPSDDCACLCRWLFLQRLHVRHARLAGAGRRAITDPCRAAQIATVVLPWCLMLSLYAIPEARDLVHQFACADVLHATGSCDDWLM